MLNFIYVLVVSIFVTGINLSAIFSASEPSVRQMLASAIFIVFWLLFSMYKGLNHEKSFLTFSSCFWAVGLILSFAGAIEALRAVALTAIFIFTGASYGLLYAVSDGFIGTQYIIYAIAIPFSLSIIGYFIGAMIGKVEAVAIERK